MAKEYRRKPTEQIANLTAAGVFLEVGGGAAWGIAAGESGDNATLIQVVGLVITGAGSALLFVGLVGWGVVVGLRARAKETDAA